MTTIQAAPDSAQAKVYFELAQRIAEHETSAVPAPLEVSALRDWAASWADQLLAVETGEIREPGEMI
jgi:nitrogenase iron protein NifH